MRLYTYAGSGNGYKVELLLALIGRSFERVEVPIFAGASRTPEFLAKNPAGRIPVLELDDGTCLPESNRSCGISHAAASTCPRGSQTRIARLPG